LVAISRNENYKVGGNERMKSKMRNLVSGGESVYVQVRMGQPVYARKRQSE
jgi:hypothetical protein